RRAAPRHAAHGNRRDREEPCLGPALQRPADRLLARRGGGTRPSRQGPGGMSWMKKPEPHHSALPANALGYTIRDYEGGMSTLCAGCGHDSITAALIQACFELDIEPHRVAKMSGIGCSSKTPAYFL